METDYFLSLIELVIIGVLFVGLRDILLKSIYFDLAVSHDKPNVIVIYSDQLRAQSLPLFGEHQIKTPHIDRLASEFIYR